MNSTQGGWGHWIVNYTSPLSLAYILWGLLLNIDLIVQSTSSKTSKKG